MPGKHSSWSLEIVSLANLFICKRPKILEDSMLSRSERRRIPQSESQLPVTEVTGLQKSVTISERLSRAGKH